MLSLSTVAATPHAAEFDIEKRLVSTVRSAGSKGAPMVDADTCCYRLLWRGMATTSATPEPSGCGARTDAEFGASDFRDAPDQWWHSQASIERPVRCMFTGNSLISQS